MCTIIEYIAWILSKICDQCTHFSFRDFPDLHTCDFANILMNAYQCRKWGQQQFLINILFAFWSLYLIYNVLALFGNIELILVQFTTGSEFFIFGLFPRWVNILETFCINHFDNIFHIILILCFLKSKLDICMSVSFYSEM